MNLKETHLLYNALAHFHTMERYPDGIVKAISDDGAKGLEATCWMLQELSEQYALYQKSLGYEMPPTLKEGDYMVRLRPMDIMPAKTMILDAITHGMKAEEDEMVEVDEVLQELQKKTENSK